MNINKEDYVQNVTRVELIDGSGRVYVNMNVGEVILSLQDNKRTLKIRPIEGKLLVWSHYLMHGSIPYIGNNDKIYRCTTSPFCSNKSSF